MADNLKLWKSWSRPPEDALKKITGGRLSGKSDINPQWRLEALTEALGPCGIGWRYEIVNLWTVPGTEGEICAFSRVDVRIRDWENEGAWSEPIPGIGGAMLVEKERSGLHTSDEAFKMATTDALSVAFKALGVAADVYRGRFDGSKYSPDAPGKAPASPQGASDPKAHHSPERRKAAAALFKGLDNAFGEGKPWEDARKLRVLKEVFGTGNIKQITAMSNDEWMQLYTDNFAAVLEAAVKSTEAEKGEEDESGLPF